MALYNDPLNDYEVHRYLFYGLIVAILQTFQHASFVMSGGESVVLFHSLHPSILGSNPDKNNSVWCREYLRTHGEAYMYIPNSELPQGAWAILGASDLNYMKTLDKKLLRGLIAENNANPLIRNLSAQDLLKH